MSMNDRQVQNWATVFVSYSSKNLHAAKMVVGALQLGGLSCWYAKENIEGGEIWVDEIVEAIAHAKVMVLLVSPDFNESVQTRKEIILGIEHGLPILPIRITDFQPYNHLRYFLCDCQWIDASEGLLKDRLDLIVQAVGTLPGRRLKRSKNGVCIDFQGAPPEGLVNAWNLGIERSDVFLDLRMPKARLSVPVQPSQLLQAYNSFIPLVGREREIEEMTGFLEEPGLFRWQVHYGEGGIGKTRLAIEFARIASRKGWYAGFLDGLRLHAFVESDGLLHWSPGLPTLIVIDYAASKASDIAKLFDFFAGIEAMNSSTIRVILLERHVDEDKGWLREVLSAGEGEIRDLIQRVCYLGMRELSPPTFGSGKNLNSYDSLRHMIEQTFTAWGKISGADAPSLPDFEPKDWRRLELNTCSRPLYIQMAAIHACETGSAQSLPSWGRSELLSAAVGRERSYVERVCGSGDLKVAVEYIAAFLCIAGVGLSYKRGWLRKVGKELEELGITTLSPNRVEQQRKAIFHEPPELDHESEVGLIQPDIVSEGFAAIVLREHENPPVETLRVVIDETGIRAWLNIIRMVQDLDGLKNFENIRDWLPGLIDGRPMGELMEVSAILPEHTASLHQFSLCLNERIISQSDNRLSPMAKGKILLAIIIHRLRSGTLSKNDLAKTGNELDECQQIFDTIEIDEDMPEILATRAKVHRWRAYYFERNKQSKAANQENLLGVLIACGKAKVESDYDKIKIDFSLPDNLPIPDHPVLKKEMADCLNNYSLSNDNLEENCRAAELAVDIGEALAVHNYRLYAGDLARYLNNFSNALYSLKQLETARVHAIRSADIREKLVGDNPDEYAEACAFSLRTLISLEYELKNYKGGNEISQKMLKIYQDLAARNPTRFRQDLAQSHQNIGYFCYHIGKFEYGLHHTIEALKIREELIEYDFNAHALALAWSHHNAGSFYDDIGGHSEAAIEHLLKAYELRVQWREKHPEVHVEGIDFCVNKLIKLYGAEKDQKNKSIWQEIRLKGIEEDNHKGPKQKGLAYHEGALEFHRDGMAAMAAQTMDKAVENFQSAFDFDSGAVVGSPNDCCNLASALVFLGDWSKNIELLHRSEKICRTVLENLGEENLSYVWGCTTSNLGYTLFRQGEIQQDPELLKHSIDVLVSAAEFFKAGDHNEALKETKEVLTRAQNTLNIFGRNNLLISRDSPL